ncbi:MAG: FMN-binding negative transcriptional regulator [Inhella sp.]
MYLPPQFAEPRVEELQRIVRENPLGMLVTHGAAGLDAEHLPFWLEEDEGGALRLLAHVARANPVWQTVREGEPVLVVFRGVQGYISPNWYPGKQETHRRVPTWNYEVVHAHGSLQARDGDEKFLRGVLARLTRQHEASQPTPWKMSGALRRLPGRDPAAHRRHRGACCTRLEGKRKLSQHHATPDREGAIRGLEEPRECRPGAGDAGDQARPWRGRTEQVARSTRAAAEGVEGGGGTGSQSSPAKRAGQAARPHRSPIEEAEGTVPRNTAGASAATMAAGAQAGHVHAPERHARRPSARPWPAPGLLPPAPAGRPPAAGDDSWSDARSRPKDRPWPCTKFMATITSGTRARAIPLCSARSTRRASLKRASA